jgi:coupling of ubiquitin conjugation to ER degradation protein 1
VEEEKDLGKGKKAWSSSKEERQSLLQKRRDAMILEARRKMEAKLKAEKDGSA